MVTSVQTNLQSLNAQRSLGTSQSSLATAMQRLSSGLRINSAKDDAAGLAVSNRMTSQIKGLDQAVRNANDGISIAQTAEGALGEITNNLQSLRQLAVQSANGTYTTTDRASMQQQAAQIQQEITRLATQTQFNGNSLLDGSFTQVALQVGAYANQTISFDIDSVKAADIGANQAVSKDSVGPIRPQISSLPHIGVNAAGNLKITSDLAPSGVSVGVNRSDSAKTISEKINAQTKNTGVVASARTDVTLSGLSGIDVDNTDPANPVADKISFLLQGKSINVGDGKNAVTMSALANAINAVKNDTGVSATYNSDDTITLTAADGADIFINSFTDDSGGNGTLASINVGGATLSSGDSIIVGGQLSLSPAPDTTLTAIMVDDGTAGNSILGTSTIRQTAPSTDVQTNGVAEQTLTVTGSTGTANVSVPVNTSAFGIAQLVNEQSSKTSVTATARTEATLSDLSAAGTVSFKLAGSNASPVTISANVTSANDLSEVAKAINNVASSTGITAELSDDKKTVKLVSADGYDIKIADFSNTAASTADTVKLNGFTLTEGAEDSLTVGGKVSFNASGPFTVTSTDSTIVSGTTTSHLSPVSGVDIGTQQGATDAIDVVDGAIAVVDRLRGMLGAIQNRLSSVVSSNQATTLNVTSARSQVQDTDFAAETSNLSRAQILQQADLAMIAQANQLPQQVLKLLQ